MEYYLLYRDFICVEILYVLRVLGWEEGENFLVFLCFVGWNIIEINFEGVIW